jgi:hypothetical protein
MRRHAHANPLARRQLATIKRSILEQPPLRWPTHISLAMKLLPEQSTLSDRRQLLIEAITFAYECTTKIGTRSDNLIQARNITLARDKFKRIANCCRRAPAHVRNQVDAAVLSCLSTDYVDLETIEALFDALADTFAKYPDCEPARTALSAIIFIGPHEKRYDTLKRDYSVLSANQQQAVQTAVKSVHSRLGAELSCSALFQEMTSVIKPPRPVSAQIQDLLVTYVEQLGRIWQRYGLKVTRRNSFSRPGIPSPFHRFVDLILTATVEPNSKRHVVPPGDILHQARSSYFNAPRSLRTDLSARPRRSDQEFLISDDHVKKAIIALKKRR